MSTPARLLGFAFASADFLFEMDDKGTILFAAGAANDLVRESGDGLVGKPAGKLFKPSEGVKFATFAKALKTGERAGPFKLTLIGGADAHLCMFRLGENGHAISCTLAHPGSRKSSKPSTDPATGLATRDGFMAAAEAAGDRDALTLVDVPGLTELCAKMTPETAERLMQQIGDSMQQAGASAAGRISATGFGAVAPAAKGRLGLAQRIAEVFAADGLVAPKMAETCMGLAAPGLTPEQRVLSLRYVVDRFAGKGRAEGGDMLGAFTSMMDETQQRLAVMTRTVGEGAFEIAYQPICELATGAVHHYEALARFDNNQGTGDTVKFIEALGIANAFDLAVASKILNVVEGCDASVAFNVSGATLASPTSFGMLAALLARRRKLAPRVLIEITETAGIPDLEAAGKAIAVLRQMGYRVGLDDFGAGAASLNYLHALQVDFVKFDGAMVMKIGTSTRDDALLAGLAKLCREMGVSTIAEWIETPAMAKAALALGFDQGQGKFHGAPLKEIPAMTAGLGKRKGLRESWG